jgi:hypothetical protein
MVRYSASAQVTNVDLSQLLLVAREDIALEHGDLDAVAGQEGGGGGSRRPAAEDQDAR